METASPHATGTVRGIRRPVRPLPARKPIDWYVILSLMLIGTMALAGTHFGWQAVKERRPKAETFPLTLSGKPLAVPAAWLSDGSIRAGQDLQRVDLIVPLHTGAEHDQAREMDRVVLIRLTPADGAVPPEMRTETLYARFFDSNVWTSPGGLILRGFARGTPYEDEELYLAPPDGKDFAARCPRSDVTASIGSPIGTGMCIWEFRTDGVDALVAFAPARLSDWPNIAATARETLALVTRR